MLNLVLNDLNIKTGGSTGHDNQPTQRVFSSYPNSQKSATVAITSNLTIRAWSIKCRRKKKLIAQFGWKLRDERFEPVYD